jgi:hypothetical protein
MALRTALRSGVAALALALVSQSASALVFRAYLSAAGNDANPCTLAQPCRLLPAALAAVVPDGEIWMLDSANFNTGPVIVPKSVSILAVPGAVGSVLAVGGPAITLAGPGLTVGLRNLVIAGLAGGGGTHGVTTVLANRLNVENCLFANLGNSGIYFVGQGSVKVANSTFRNNAGYAIRVEGGAAVDVSNSQMTANTLGGVYAYGSLGGAGETLATISDSSIAYGGVGVLAESPVAAARIVVTRSTIQGTTTALSAQGGAFPAIVSVSGSALTNNGTSYSQVGATSIVASLGNNHLINNGAGVGAITPIPPL